MKIIISGGLGYVGGRLSKYLADKGYDVVALSRQAGSLRGSKWPQRLTVSSPDQYRDPKLLNGAGAFIHLASLNEIDCVKHPAEAIDVNITQTLQWLDKAHEAGIKKFIYFSTAHVYGKPLRGYYDEQTLAQPLHPYAITHKCAEDYVLLYAAEKGMQNIVVRLTNSFGGPAFPTADRWTLLINDLCRSAVTKGTMTLQSDGLQVRDFICLHDVCAAVDHFINIQPQTGNGVFNLGAGYSRTVWDVALQVKTIAERLLGRSILLERKEPSPNTKTDPLTISIEKLTSTGFQFRNDIEAEIESTVNYFAEYRHEP